jgi:hypothetical protein
MRSISSADLVRSFSVHSDAALSEPIVITRNGRARLVMMSIVLFRELLARATEKDGERSLERLEDELEALLSTAA